MSEWIVRQSTLDLKPKPAATIAASKCRNGHEIKRADRKYATASVHVRNCECGTVRTDSTADDAERAFIAAFGAPKVMDEIDPDDLADVLSTLAANGQTPHVLVIAQRMWKWIDRRRG